MAFEFQSLKIENWKPGLWLMKISRPSAMNALNTQVLSDMAEFLRNLGEMDYEHARGLIITGEGDKAFVAGADIKEISELNEEQALAFADRGQSIFQELALLRFPVVAAVNGFALGGGLELALACDFIMASEGAKLGLPETTLGLIPGFGGTVRLARAVGLRRARAMIFSGDMITATEAQSYGLVQETVPASQLVPRAKAWLEKVMERAPEAVALAKRSINQAWDMDLDEAHKMEARHFADLFRGEDVREGTKAFLEKRKPAFKGL